MHFTKNFFQTTIIKTTTIPNTLVKGKKMNLLDVVIFYPHRSPYSNICFLACWQAHSASSGAEIGQKLEILVKNIMLSVYNFAQAIDLTCRCESLSKPVQTHGQLSLSPTDSIICIWLCSQLWQWDLGLL